MLKAMLDTVEVRVHGQVFKMRANYEEGYIERIAEYVDGILAQLSRSFGSQPGHRLAVMAAIQIADTLFQEKAKNDAQSVRQEETEEVEAILSRLIVDSDRLLGQDNK
ncbi:MAG: cell division protein ZapA [Magnetococcales bacterium]|nr:cell division protein ZapA [Magnetococcales bacterium]